MDAEQIKRNRRTVSEGYLESPWCADMDDTDADWPGRIMDQRPSNRDGLVPSLKPDRRYENEG